MRNPGFFWSLRQPIKLKYQQMPSNFINAIGPEGKPRSGLLAIGISMFEGRNSPRQIVARNLASA
jgi:hypothetical protein